MRNHTADRLRHSIRVAVASLLLLSAPWFTQAVAAADEPILVIAYETALENRPAFIDHMMRTQAGRLQRWQQDGVVKDYQLFVNRYADEGAWDIKAVLTFADTAALQRWQAIERVKPGGLDARELKLVKSMRTAQVDLFERVGTSGAGAHDSAFLIIPYDYLVSLGEYKKYLQGYAFPQMDGWIEEGILESYSMYLARYPAGRTWTALLVLEYTNEHALAQRPSVMAKVRERLANVASWKAISDSKQAVREEGRVVVADQLAP